MGEIKWDDGALMRAAGEAARAEVAARSARIASTANSMSAGNPTGFYHRDHRSPAVGGTTPRYDWDMGESRKSPKVPVGLVYTGNYAAMKDNAENNTLLKARG